jgi:tetratricopeptide (TPR) repeat protein
VSAALVLVAIVLATARVSVAPPTPAECDALRHHGQRKEAHACYQALTLASDGYLRAEGAWGLELYQDANTEFRAAVTRDDRNAHYRVRWGRLLRERFNDAEAVKLFAEALQRDPRSAEAYLGLALAGADTFDRRARANAEKALELDPTLVEARELVANLALQDSSPAEAATEADRAIQMAEDALDAYAIHAAVELLADRSPDAWIERMLRVNPSYGRGYALIASHLVLNRRYDEGVAYYRKAIALDPRLWSARSELGINLMRLGEEVEPRRQLELCYNNGYRDAATVNTLRLLDSYKNFVVFKTPQAILKLDGKEADVLRPYVEAVLQRAMATYAQKYQISLPGPVQVELYPNHEDFAVRTEGLPGLGALGVTFGTVVAMDSPSGRTPGSFNWADTLWHEMNHVYVLTATKHRVPRWFAEGLAVHEEGQGNPAWADRLTPEVVVALKNRKLLPVAQLDRGFVHPEYPEQVIVSYYQAGRICDYIQERWGATTLVDMIHAFAALTPTSDVIRQSLGLAPDAFDAQFQTWAYKGAGPIVNRFDEWRAGLKRRVDLVTSGQSGAALTEGEAVRRLYPEYVQDANAYEFLSRIKIAQGDKAGALAVLVDYQKFGGSDPATLKQLASLQEESGQPRQAAATLEGITDIYPVTDQDLHRRLGALLLKQENFAGAVREYSAVVALKPLDKAGALYELAEAHFAAHQLDKAEQAVVAALEAAPGYRPAQQLLLKIEEASAKPRR